MFQISGFVQFRLLLAEHATAPSQARLRRVPRGRRVAKKGTAHTPAEHRTKTAEGGNHPRKTKTHETTKTTETKQTAQANRRDGPTAKTEGRVLQNTWKFERPTT
jgi:hypothetical protein